MGKRGEREEDIEKEDADEAGRRKEGISMPLHAEQYISRAPRYDFMEFMLSLPKHKITRGDTFRGVQCVPNA